MLDRMHHPLEELDSSRQLSIVFFFLMMRWLSNKSCWEKSYYHSSNLYTDSADWEPYHESRLRITFYVMQTFCRQFLWHELMLWPEDMPAKSLISCSAYDDLVPSKLVGAHLKATNSPAKFMLHPTAAHGGIFLDAPYQRRIINQISAFVTAKAWSKKHRRSS